MTNKKSEQEKRNFTRMRINTNVTFTVDGQDSVYQGRCKNISGAGMLLQTNHTFPLGTYLHLTVPSDQAEAHNINVLAEVKRVDTLEEHGQFELGIVVKEFKA